MIACEVCKKDCKNKLIYIDHQEATGVVVKSFGPLCSYGCVHKRLNQERGETTEQKGRI